MMPQLRIALNKTRLGSFQLLRGPDGTPATQWESSPPQQRGSEEELLSFVREWDKFGKLHLARPTEVSPSERHQLLPVPKDE